MTQRMEIDLLFDAGLFQCLAHHPTEAFDRVATIGFLSVEQVHVGMFCRQVFMQSAGHHVTQGHDAILFVLAFPDMDGFAFEIHISNLQVDRLLTAQTGRVDEGQQDAVLEQVGSLEELPEFFPVQNHGQGGLPLKGGQADGPFVVPDQAVVVAQAIDHVFETAPRG